MHDGIFECLTIQIKLNQKIFILSSVYRSPSLLNEFTTGFLENFENFLSLLNNNASPIFIFSDSNINLYNLGVCNIAQNYLNCIHSNGFLQKIFNSTRIQNQSASLIDHINCKNEPINLTFGTILTDISDHLTNFILLNDTIIKPKRKQKFVRKLSQDQMSNFRNALHALHWETVLQTQNCNDAFGEFWEIFQTLFNLYFPLTRQKFNKKIHSINGYMTKGLLISRKNKLNLYKNFTKNKTDENFQKFKRYRNIYNSLVRLSKKLYYQHKVNSCKSPKMVWETYN
jgi:hypothetical protein